MIGDFRIGISVCEERLSPSAPVVYTGNIKETIEKCAALGYDGIELQLRDPDQLDADMIRSLLKKHNMKVCAIATGLEYSLNHLSMISDDIHQRLIMRQKLFSDVALAEKFGCLVIIGCVRGNIPSGTDPARYLERFREEMLILADEAEKHGVTVVIEAINFYVNNYLCTVKSVCDFVDNLGRGNIKVHIDTHHMAIEETSIRDAIRYAGRRIGYVHISENNRMYPGATNGDYGMVMQELKAAGYKGWMTFEITPRPDPDTAARCAIEHMKERGGNAV